MSHAKIIEISLSPIPAEDRIDNCTIECCNNWFIGTVADYLSDAPLDRDTTIEEMAQIARTSRNQSYEIGWDAHGKYILVKSKEEYFRPMWEHFKREWESTVSLEKFISYRGEDDKFGDYIYADGELMVFPEFIRGCVVGEPYYIGGIVSYHSKREARNMAKTYYTERQHIGTLKQGTRIWFGNAHCTVTSDAHLHPVPGQLAREWRIAVTPEAGILYLYESMFKDGMVDVIAKECAPDTAHDNATAKSPWSFTGEHRLHDDYVITAIPNAYNDKTSWWISKHGCTVAMYCFSTSGSEQNQEKEAEYQQQHIDSYIRAFESRFFGKEA